MNITKRLKSNWHGQKGFTLVEILIVIAVLGILAAVVIVNYGHINSTSYKGAANDELAKVRLAEQAYFGDHNQTYPETSLDEEFTSYFDRPIKGKYTFNTETGEITAAEPYNWPHVIYYNAEKQQWLMVPTTTTP